MRVSSSRIPAGGRCTFYAGYAELRAAYLDARTEVMISAERDEKILAGLAEALEASLERMMEGLQPFGFETLGQGSDADFIPR